MVCTQTNLPMRGGEIEWTPIAGRASRLCNDEAVTYRPRLRQGALQHRTSPYRRFCAAVGRAQQAWLAHGSSTRVWICACRTKSTMGIRRRLCASAHPLPREGAARDQTEPPSQPRRAKKMMQGRHHRRLQRMLRPSVAPLRTASSVACTFPTQAQPKKA